jgi:glycosyltransferase involved in cell wall biosynthesis
VQPKTVIITSIPSPYRVTVFDELNDHLDNNFIVLYISKTIPTFKWEESPLKHNHHFIYEYDKHELNKHKGIINKLKKIDPDIIITCGFNKTMLLAMFYAILKNKKLIANTDAWELNEKSYSWLHILIRKIMYRRMNAFIPVSKKGYDNFLRYNIKKEKIFISHYAIDNEYSAKFIENEKKYDIMFSGQFIDRKMPLFFCEIAKKLNALIPNFKVLLLGDGDLKDDVLQTLKTDNVNFHYAGFVQKDELPKYYASAKIFLFPTKLDSWGVVANDACAVGVPILTTENAGVAGDLIINDYNGYILPIDVNIWSEKIKELLEDNIKYQEFSKNTLSQIKKYNSKEAAEGILNATKYVMK